MKTIDLFIPGLPVAQPRLRSAAFRGRSRVYTPSTANAWKAIVMHEVRQFAGHYPAGVPLRCDLTFIVPRPRGHFGSGKNAGTVKASAPTRPTGKPDKDNLEKAVLDAITAAGVWADDSQVTAGDVRKRYAPAGKASGCWVTIREDVE